MSIDIIFHTQDTYYSVNKIIDFISKENPNLFDINFIIYQADESNDIDKEIAKEFHFNSISNFRVSLNKKEMADRINEMVLIVRNYFDKESLVLFQNETPIK